MGGAMAVYLDKGNPRHLGNVPVIDIWTNSRFLVLFLFKEQWEYLMNSQSYIRSKGDNGFQQVIEYEEWQFRTNYYSHQLSEARDCNCLPFPSIKIICISLTLIVRNTVIRKGPLHIYFPSVREHSQHFGKMRSKMEVIQ